VSRARWVVFAYQTLGARALQALLARDEPVVAVVTLCSGLRPGAPLGGRS